MLQVAPVLSQWLHAQAKALRGRKCLYVVVVVVPPHRQALAVTSLVSSAAFVSMSHVGFVWRGAVVWLGCFGGDGPALRWTPMATFIVLSVKIVPATPRTMALRMTLALGCLASISLYKELCCE